MPKNQFFQKKKVAIICVDKVIYIADSIKECSRIFRRPETFIRQIIKENTKILEYRFRFAKESDVVEIDPNNEDLSTAVVAFKERLQDWSQSCKNVRVAVIAKKQIKTKSKLVKKSVYTQAKSRLELLLSIWKQKTLKEPSADERLVCEGLATLPYTEFYVNILQTHIESRTGRVLSETYIKRTLALLNPFVRKKQNIAKHSQLEIETYYLLNQDVAVVRHSLRNSLTQTDFFKEKEFEHILSKIKKKYGVDIIGCEFNVFLSE